jgi:hypothetical protein
MVVRRFEGASAVSHPAASALRAVSSDTENRVSLSVVRRSTPPKTAANLPALRAGRHPFTSIRIGRRLSAGPGLFAILTGDIG